MRKGLLMRTLGIACVALSLVAAVVDANAPAPIINPIGSATASTGTADDAAVDLLLQQLDRVGKDLNQFSAKLKLTESDPLGGATVRTGSVYFRKPDGGAQIHVTFDKRIDESHIAHSGEKIEYLLDGRWLIDRNYRTKTEIKREVLKPGQKMDLFKLGEGPFPLPIGQDPRDVRKTFDVKRVASAKDDPPRTVHLTLIPKAGTDLARSFHSIDVWVDDESHMPARVDTLDAKQQIGRSTELNDIVVNPGAPGLKDSDFQLPNVDRNWNRRVESLND